jgi:anthranilate/para-aminobenzoate synthase component I
MLATPVISTFDLQLPMARAAALFAALRSRGPAFIATCGNEILVGALAPTKPLYSWADFAQVSRGPAAFGTVGYLAYEAGAWLDDLSTKPAPPVPLAWLGTCEAALVLSPGRPAEIRGDADAGKDLFGIYPEIPVDAPSGSTAVWSPAADYRDGVGEVLRHLRAGDCYQVNLARTVDVTDPGDPLQVWLRLHASNPARRAMLLDTGAFTVLSNSPELLLGVRGTSLLSVPIKGTRPGHRRPDALLHSPKERAELTMIVDLVRADLGRVAKPGSVRADPRRVGRVGHLWHAMQRVYAQLDTRDGRQLDAVDALAALFPAGSVTGAPKLRASAIIEALEPAPRGVYCGSMGWFGADGSAYWNVAIRTMTFLGPKLRPDLARLHAGAGIVWGSEPARECLETEWKAQKMLEALCR